MLNSFEEEEEEVMDMRLHLPELKCERFVEPFSVSLSSGRLRESPISGLGHSIPASGSAAISTINPHSSIRCPLHDKRIQMRKRWIFFSLSSLCFSILLYFIVIVYCST